MVLIATSAMIGTAISCLFIPRLGDLYGRWPVYVFALTLQLPIYCAACLFTKTLYMIIICFFLGPVIIGRMACGFLLLLEIMPRRHQPMVGASLMVAEGACLIIWTGYFVWISKNAFWFLWFTIILNLIGLIGCAYLTESPRYLYGMERFEDCRKTLKVIATRNGIQNYSDAVFPEESELMIESSDDPVERISKINTSGPLRTSE
jgi:MFS family permease